MTLLTTKEMNLLAAKFTGEFKRTATKAAAQTKLEKLADAQDPTGALGREVINAQDYATAEDVVDNALNPAPAPKKRGCRFILPKPQDMGEKEPRKGRRRALYELLLTGATFEEAHAATWGQAAHLTEARARQATYEAIRLLHYAHGFGLNQDAQGRIYITGVREEN